MRPRRNREYGKTINILTLTDSIGRLQSATHQLGYRRAKRLRSRPSQVSRGGHQVVIDRQGRSHGGKLHLRMRDVKMLTHHDALPRQILPGTEVRRLCEPARWSVTMLVTRFPIAQSRSGDPYPLTPKSLNVFLASRETILVVSWIARRLEIGTSQSVATRV